MNNIAIYIGYCLMVFMGISIPLSECIISAATIGWNVIGALLDMVLSAISFTIVGFWEARA